MVTNSSSLSHTRRSPHYIFRGTPARATLDQIGITSSSVFCNPTGQSIRASASSLWFDLPGKNTIAISLVAVFGGQDIMRSVRLRLILRR